MNVYNMKLYATTTSERASKGQGGNKYLKINVMNDKQEQIVYIEIMPSDLHNGKTSIVSYFSNKLAITEKYVLEDITKGKSQKGEKCRNCKKSNLHEEYDPEGKEGDILWWCDDCSSPA